MVVSKHHDAWDRELMTPLWPILGWKGVKLDQAALFPEAIREEGFSMNTITMSVSAHWWPLIHPMVTVHSRIEQCAGETEPSSLFLIVLPVFLSESKEREVLYCRISVIQHSDEDREKPERSRESRSCLVSPDETIPKDCWSRILRLTQILSTIPVFWMQAFLSIGLRPPNEVFQVGYVFGQCQ